ncbi:MAG: hypothetical protein J5662_07145 [Clostridia bacterium]|nr:hypothetical protein [Clostridia bacterium]
MKNKELIDFYNSGEDCKFCPYDDKECDQFLQKMGCPPWAYRKNDEEFLSREVGESK